ncbi:MAG: 23S rRNA (pseudouridine(1915)-N(3))-methyltransferase RlmH [Thermaurantimonas sp.]
MKISVYSIGKSNILFVKEAEAYYTRKIRHYTKFELIRQEAKRSWGTNAESIQKAERDLILRSSAQADRLILLDERGEHLSSKELATYIAQLQNESVRHSMWVIGGAYGFHPDFYTNSQKMISLSRLTFSHPLARIIVLEQLYRAFTILHNHPYHHD